jgi:hypothetical protein
MTLYLNHLLIFRQNLFIGMALGFGRSSEYVFVPNMETSGVRGLNGVSSKRRLFAALRKSTS